MGGIITIFTVVEPVRDRAFTQVTINLLFWDIWQQKEESKRVLMMVTEGRSMRQSSALNMEIKLAFGAVKGEAGATFTAGITGELTVSIGRKGEKKRVFGVRLV